MILTAPAPPAHNSRMSPKFRLLAGLAGVVSLNCAGQGPVTLPDNFGQNVSCPPAGAFGTEPGDVIPDLALEDCDGNTHHIHDLCNRDAAWLFVYAGW